MGADVHATADGVILMFHDADLDRTTTGTGLIRKQTWKGGIECAAQACRACRKERAGS